MIGITSYGAYIPRLRLSRSAIYQAMGWFSPAIVMVAQGERSMCNWDEDSVTMAVEASRNCLQNADREKIDGLCLASTSFPFSDRQNSGVVSTALNLREDITAADFTASQKSGTTALLWALEAAAGPGRKNLLVTAADCRMTKPGGFYEMWYGDGAASFAVGTENVIAKFEGSHSVSCDFVDHYRGALNRFDYTWEERWVRDQGYSKIIPEAVNGLLKKLDLTIDKIDRLAYPCFFTAEHKKIAKKLGADPEKVIGNMHEVCGDTGCAHPLLMLAAAIDEAEPGQKIVAAGFGQGSDALCFSVTEKINDFRQRPRVKPVLENREPVENYPKWLVFRGLMEPEMGIRAEAPTQTAMTTLWRRRKMILGLVGGKCTKCGTPQFPKTDVCVNPGCTAYHTQEDYEFADMPARVKTFTGDMLAVSYDPPHIYGMIQFEGGGRFMADFTDCRLSGVKVGLPVEMVFRKRTEDKERGFVNYFWKARPAAGAAEEMSKIRFDGQVAVITGAGGGLGRAYALELASRGAKVVVNDLGSARDGTGEGSAAPAQQVVDEIKAAGGEAVASYDSVATADGGENIIKCALDTYGRVDILINNAGILRDKSLIKMEPENWNAVLAVHLHGACNVTRPAFGAMRQQGYGRIIMTTSGAGLYGNFGQSNYSAAKMGLVGMMNTLKLEGKKHDIKVNTIAPLAASRLTEDIMPPDLLEKMRPELVTPMVVYLASDQCTETGEIFNAGMGYFSRAAVLTGSGSRLGEGEDPPAPEKIAENFSRINDLTDAKETEDANAALFALVSPPEDGK
ncbi:MAG: SDR family NAD(P)-dependent oxidoreductase [Desulfosalsimonas sp.]